MEKNIIHNENCLTGLKKLPDNCIDCCITSPPYFGLRDYGNKEQIGLEDTPELFVEQLVNVFAEVKRVLKPEGTLWLNLGDSYSDSGKGIGDTTGDKWKQSTNKGTRDGSFIKVNTGLKPKDLIGIPWMVAFALRTNGWYLRQDIIWNKPNPMPESVTDRCTKAHEYIFLMSKSAKYYYDADSIKTDCKNPEDDLRRLEQQTWDNKNTPDKLRNGIRPKTKSTFGNRDGELNKLHSGNPYFAVEKANKRSVWTVNTKPFKEAHFATFPEGLIVDMIKAGCPEYVCNKCGKARENILEREQLKRDRPNAYVKNPPGSLNNTIDQTVAGVSVKVVGLTDCGCGAGFSGGIVLDPFMGGGTTGLVARKLNRNYIGFELNPKYLKIANDRIYNKIGLFL